MDKPAPSRRSRPYMMAMVLGTALTALSPTSASADAGHDPAVAELSRYCTACWRNARLPVDRWGDCTQDVLCRLLQTVPRDSWARSLRRESPEHRELVRAIDAVKKRTQRQKKWTAAGLEQTADRGTERREGLAAARAEVEHAAEEVLSARQQGIVRLSFEGWSVEEIGKQLRLPPARVSDEKYKAVRKLRAHLAI